GAVSLSGLRTTPRRALEVSGESQWPSDRVLSLAKRTATFKGARPVPGMERRSAPAQRALAGLQHALSDSAVGSSRALCLARSGAHGQACSARLAAAVRASYLLAGN